MSESGGAVITYFNITSSMIAPLVNSINENLQTMIPIGLGIMGTFIGISIVKRIIYSFI